MLTRVMQPVMSVVTSVKWILTWALITLSTPAHIQSSKMEAVSLAASELCGLMSLFTMVDYMTLLLLILPHKISITLSILNGPNLSNKKLTLL